MIDNTQCQLCLTPLEGYRSPGDLATDMDPMVCRDCALNHWVPMAAGVKPGKCFDVHHQELCASFLFDCWSVGTDLDTGVPIGRRIANCRVGMDDRTVIYGPNCQTLPGATHWRLVPLPPKQEHSS